MKYYNDGTGHYYNIMGEEFIPLPEKDSIIMNCLPENTQKLIQWVSGIKEADIVG